MCPGRVNSDRWWGVWSLHFLQYLFHKAVTCDVCLGDLQLSGDGQHGESEKRMIEATKKASISPCRGWQLEYSNEGRMWTCFQWRFWLKKYNKQRSWNVSMAIELFAQFAPNVTWNQKCSVLTEHLWYEHFACGRTMNCSTVLCWWHYRQPV